jgi:hypothetical protein
MTIFKYLLIIFIGIMSINLIAQNSTTGQKASMLYIASFEAGQPGAGIYKLYDASDDVICYVLMPDTASRKQIDGKWVYDSNTLGSLSCLKANTPPKSLQPIK